MSDSLKLSTALPGDDEINGLDAHADTLVSDPSQMVCAVLILDVKDVRYIIDTAVLADLEAGLVCAVLILDVKDVRYITDSEGHVPTLRFRRGEAWLLADTPEAVRLAMIERAEQRMGRTPLPFGELGSKSTRDDTRPDPHDCDHVEYQIERDHLEDVPDGQFRETCLRCGWVQYQPVADLPARIAALEGDAPTLSLVPDDAEGECGHVMEALPVDDGSDIVLLERCTLCGHEERHTAKELGW